MSVELLLFGAIGALGAGAAPVIPLSWRLGCVLALSVVQLYVIPVGEVTFALWLASAYLLWPEFVREFRNVVHVPALRTIMLLVLVQVASWSWSPDVRMGLEDLVYTLPFLLVSAASLSLGRDNPAAVARLTSLAAVLMLSEAALVIVFRLSPDLEWSYLNTSVAGWFATPRAVTDIVTGVTRNNILDPAKAGGFFLNGNTAAAYLGAGSAVAYYACREEGGIMAWTLLAVLSAGIFFSGSKSGAILAVLLPVATMTVVRHTRHRGLREWAITLAWIALAGLAAFGIAVIYPALESSSFVSNTIDTTASRLAIWAYAAQAFFNHPLLGQGFGGWEIGYRTYQHVGHTTAVLPPHNTLIYLWSQSGLAAVLLALVFMYQVFRLAAEHIRSSDATARSVGVCLLMVAAWIFISGMGDNSGLLGEVHEQPLLASMLGLCYALDARRELAKRIGLLLSAV
ncbi:MAG TPA: O-antigen ligase family protein [Steroidobacteraceae bacterium]|nr:O-antigen ligase family protein [Steroidobacteraceae bacterium]